MEHLQDRPNDWPTATDEEWTKALMKVPAFIDPFFMAYAQRHRPHCLRRAILLHQDLGGFVGRPAQRWLRGKGARRRR